MQLSTAKKIAYELLKREGLLKLGWRCGFDDSKKRLGVCDFDRKLITFSRYFIALNADSVTLETVRHEIAHALAPGDDHHGIEWQQQAARLGAKAEPCADNKSTVAPAHDFVGTCLSCGDQILRHREPKTIGRSACPDCCHKESDGEFDARFIYVWRNTKTKEIYSGGRWEKDYEAGGTQFSFDISDAFAVEFGATAVIESKEIAKLPEFRFSDYSFRDLKEGVIRAFLEVKIFREVKAHRVLKTYWRLVSGSGIVIDVWENSFDKIYESADRRADVGKMKVGNWYELILLKNDKDYLRLQTAKISK